MRPCIALVLFVSACSGSHSASDGGDTMAYANQFIRRDCAPDDGAALRLVLADAISGCVADGTQRSLELYIFHGTDSFFPIEAPETVTSTSGTTFGNGSANACPGGTPPCETSQDWSITFDTFVEDVRASGSYVITFGSGEVRGTFDAPFCGGPALCG